MSRILVIAPHADDETLGAGGTIARMSDEAHDVTVAVLTGHGKQKKHPVSVYTHETFTTVRAEAGQAMKVLGVERPIEFRELPAVQVPDRPVHEVNKVVCDLVADCRPEMLFVPFLSDLHKDHRELVYAANVAWRPVKDYAKGIQEIYMYETLSETHRQIQPYEPAFAPNTFVDISGKY